MKEFKTQSKRILDLMINSIYTNKEIFLRELISNASDAIDKLHFISLTDDSVNGDFKIEIKPDATNKTLTISDNGIGMSESDLENNLGTIAESGTLAFKSEQKEKSELIGQFGVGFYSAFMVASKIVVESKAYGSDKAYRWESCGADGYEITPCDKASVGTTITLYIRDKDEDYDYMQFTEEYYLRSLVKKYSDYIRYPIVMEVSKTRLINPDYKEDEKPEYETYREVETLNTRTPIWKKAKADITEEEYDGFYTAKFHDYEKPNKVMHFNIEGSVNYTALLFIPSHPPVDYYQKDYQKGLQLYCNGVLIMDNCADLLPDYFGFVKGVIDSSDLSLNISREILQQDRQLRAIGNSLEKKIIAELKKYMQSNRDGYDEFFKQFGLTVKFGVYNSFGVNKEKLKDLIEFYSSSEKKLVTLSEYVSRMQADQKFIFYACGDGIERIDRLPQTELIKDKGYEILYMPDSVDEFVVKTLATFEEKEFKSVGAKDLGLESEQEKEQIKTQSDENKDLFEFMKDALDGEVKEVRLSNRMKTNAVCLTADGEVSLEMEKVFKALKTNSSIPVVAEKVLEINANHKILEKLKSLYATNREEVKKYAKLLYATALITEGMEIEDPAEFVTALGEVLAE